LKTYKKQGNDDHFIAGIVEGFYGSQWSWQLRSDFVVFLQSVGLNSYLYCPKGDPYLRKQWQSPWPQKTVKHLSGLSSQCRDNGIHFGVGLSPYQLYQHYGSPQKQSLRDKVLEINELEPAILAVLFDDMPAEQADLAAIQSEIIADIQSWMGPHRLMMCPTWYSFDPVLEAHFGERPRDYWHQLGEFLPLSVDILWTGNQVCSEHIASRDLEPICEQLGRPVVLWDNYPVNDGAKRSRYLYCRPLSNRGPFSKHTVRGHLCNPMNQGYLSMLPISGLVEHHGQPPSEHQIATAERLYGRDLAETLVRDIDQFQDRGLDNITPNEREKLAQEYSQFDHPAAKEISAWLRGEYTFDPACLTD